MLGCPDRCIHVTDREGDICELFCTATELHTHFLIRTCADRLCGDGAQTVTQQMAVTRTKGLHRVEFRDPHGHIRQARLILSFRRLRLLPSRAKRSRYPELAVTVIHAQEKDPPEGREPIDWKLVSDLPVRTRTEAVEKLHWYALCWKIEVFPPHSEVRLPDRGVAAAHRAATRQPDRGLLYRELANILAMGWTPLL